MNDRYRERLRKASERKPEPRDDDEHHMNRTGVSEAGYYELREKSEVKPLKKKQENPEFRPLVEPKEPSDEGSR